MKSKYAFWAIIIIAILLRFYKIGVIPFGYNWDETSIIYNSWGIAEWYRDEWAVKLPLAFRSFGDYKSPLMFYMLAVVYKMFGVIPSLIRIYSAIAGTLIVITTYFLSKELFPRKKLLPEISALLVAISPWAINFSRVGFEANIGLCLVAIGGLFIIKGLKDSKWWLLSALFFGLSIFAYHSTKIFVPILLLSFALIYSKKIWSQRKRSVLSTLIFFITISPIIYVTLFGGGFERGMTMIFFDGSQQIRSVSQIAGEFISNISNSLSLNFLIGGKDDVGLRHLVPGFGIMYLVELPLLIYGLSLLIKNAKKKGNIFLLSWIVIGMLPALLSHQTPHAVRSLLIMPALQIITAIGMVGLIDQLRSKHKVVQKSTNFMLSLLFIGSLGAYLRSYYGAYAKNSAMDFQYGYQEAIEISTQMGKTRDKIIFTDTYGQPYVYALLHNKIKPKQFLAGALANYEFHSIDWPLHRPNSVVVGTPEEIPPTDALVKHLVKIPGTEEVMFVIAETPKE